MIPRVFVSSTYYDLRYVRERIEKFIDSYGFEPILFESDKVTYQYDREIDHSAYYEVSLCHIMVLIVGGRYGSPSSQLKMEEERKKYDDDYISITRKEFETASQKNIPILIFIDKNVYSEYQTYKENQDFFDEAYSNKPGKENKKFKFAHVDHVNVFKFIDIVKIKPIKTFEKVEEIENYIKSQLSGMFYLYLESLKRKSDDNKILDTISELNNVTLRMNEMLTSVGKEILGGKDMKEYEKVIESQLSIMIDFFGEQLGSLLDFENSLTENELTPSVLNRLAHVIYDNALNLAPLPINETVLSPNQLYKSSRVELLQSKFSEINPKIRIKRFNLRKLNKDFKEKVLPFIKNSSNEHQIIRKIESVLKNALEELPF